MGGKEYVSLAMRTYDGNSGRRLGRALGAGKDSPDLGGVLNACLGLAGEVGELNDSVKKWVFHEKEVGEDHLKKELGDVMWYVAQMCHSFNWDLDEIMQMNIDKLKARYPEGFDPARAHGSTEQEENDEHCR